MLKILFLIHDLGQGGAEKVLVNLINHMDRSKFDISVTVLFGGGVNEQFLAPDVHFHAIFPKEVPGNSKLMKLLTPKQLTHCVSKSTTTSKSLIWKALLPALSVGVRIQTPSWFPGFMRSNTPWTSWPVLFAVKQKPGSVITDLTRRFVFHSMFTTISVGFWISKCPVRCCIIQ